METQFVLFALLPLGLASLASRLGKNDAGFLGLAALLAPVLGKAVTGLIGNKQASNDAKKKAQYEQQLAQQKEAAARAAFEAQQNDPRAVMQRMSFNTRLAQILGRFGGREKTPGFLLKAFDSARMPQQYTPGPAYIPPPQKGGGFWGAMGPIADALSYLDVTKFKGQPKPVGISPGQPVNPFFQTSLVKPNTFASGTKDFG